MRSIFETGEPQTIDLILKSKDQRVATQKSLMDKYPDDTILAVKLNIPGPIKNNDQIDRLFRRGMQRFDILLEVNDLRFEMRKQTTKASGSEAFLVVKNQPTPVKRVTVQFEDQDALGRLFDIDVLSHHQEKAISRTDLGLPVRRCFLCNRPAKECARSRRHSVAELQRQISETFATEFNDK